MLPSFNIKERLEMLEKIRVGYDIKKSDKFVSTLDNQYCCNPYSKNLIKNLIKSIKQSSTSNKREHNDKE